MYSALKVLENVEYRILENMRYSLKLEQNFLPDVLSSREYRSPNLAYFPREITSDILRFHLSSRRSVSHER